MASDDGKAWTSLGQTSGMAKATGDIRSRAFGVSGTEKASTPARKATVAPIAVVLASALAEAAKV